jgi:hypothetical protein
MVHDGIVRERVFSEVWCVFQFRAALFDPFYQKILQQKCSKVYIAKLEIS